MNALRSIARVLVALGLSSSAAALTVFDQPGVVSFDGSTGDVIELPHSPIYEIAAGSVLFTFTAADTNGPQGLFTKDASFFSGGGNHLLAYLDGSTLKARFQNGTASVTKSIGGIAAGVSYRVALTFGPGGSRVYVDGVPAASDALVMDWSKGPNVEYMQWGGRGWGSASGQAGFDAPFQGIISGRQIHDVTLSAAQVAVLHGDGPANAAPRAVDDTTLTDEDAPLLIALADLLANDSDDDGDTLAVSRIARAPASGTAALNSAAGTLTYTPGADFNGSDSFEIEVSDGNGGFATSTVAITVNAVNDAPLANDDTANAGQGAAVVIDVLGNDGDIDGDALFVVSVDNIGNGAAVVINNDGTLTYTSGAGFAGDDSFSYTASDGTDSATAMVVVKVTDGSLPVPIFDAPASVTFNGGNGDVIELPHSPIYEMAAGSVLFTFTAADTNGPQGLFTKDARNFSGGGNHLLAYLDGSTLKARFQNGSASVTKSIGGIAAGVSYRVALTFGAGGSHVYVDGVPVVSDALVMDWSRGPNIEYMQWGGRGWGSASGQAGFDAPFHGSMANRQIFDVALSAAQIAERHGDGPVNTAPRAVDDTAVTDEDAPLLIALADLLANDSDDDGDTLAVSRIARAPASGTAALNGAAGTLTYTPGADFNGSDRFEIEVSDGNGGFATSTVAVTVNAQNDDPRAIDDTATALVDSPKTIVVIANDLDIDGDPLSVDTVTNGDNGALVVNNQDGTVTYTPKAGFVGDDSFDYTIGDGNGGSDAATVMVTVLPAPNTPPVAGDDSFTVDEDLPLLIALADLLANDSDDDDDTLAVSRIARVPASGTAALNSAAGTLTYTPGADFNGSDSFEIEVSDGNGGFATSTVAITVNAVNDAPLANDDTANAGQGAAVVIDVLGNDGDIDGDALFVVSVDNIGNGAAVVINNDGTLTYTSGAGFAGDDSFSYTASDGTDSATAMVVVKVTDASLPVPIFDAPASVTFNGGNGDVIELPHSPIYEMAAGSVLFTFTAADTNGPQGLFTKDARNFSGGGNHLLAYLDGSTLKARFQNGSASVTKSIGGIAAGVSYRVALTFGAGGSHVYVDGVPAVSDALVMDWSRGPNIEYMQWGGRGWGSASGQAGFDAPFHGSMANRQIFDVALSAAQIAERHGDIDPFNAAPRAVDDSAVTDEGTPLLIAIADLLANDSDPDGDPLTLETVTNGEYGAVSVNDNNGTVTYTPNAVFVGVDSFSYSIDDGNGAGDTATVTVTVNALGDAPLIDLWYGPDQAFGDLGEPQAWVNILGTVFDDDGLQSFTYKLNGQGPVPLNTGPDTRRLESAGDFNIDLATADLLDGLNEVEITATDTAGNTAISTVFVDYTAGNPWPLPYAIDWSTPTRIEDVAQAVDGNWALVPGGVRTAEPGYDRIVALGGIEWTNYEVTVPITVHGMNPTCQVSCSSSPTGIGLIARWQGHHQWFSERPYYGWFPLGALGWFRYDGSGAGGHFNIIGGNQGLKLTQGPLTSLPFGVTHVFKLRAETIGAQHRYSLKVWPQGAAEPADWTLVANTAPSDLANGSVLLLAHHVDATFGDVSVVPISP